MRAKVIIVDDHRMMREGLRSLIEKRTDLEVVAEASTAEEACLRVKETGPDVIIVDISMPYIRGVITGLSIMSQNAGSFAGLHNDTGC